MGSTNSVSNEAITTASRCGHSTSGMARTLIGVAGLSLVEGEGPEVEAADTLRRDRWGRGYATEALRAVLGDRARAAGAPADRRAGVRQENEASRRVMEKAGMRPDGAVEAYGRTMTRHVSSR